MGAPGETGHNPVLSLRSLSPRAEAAAARKIPLQHRFEPGIAWWLVYHAYRAAWVLGLPAALAWLWRRGRREPAYRQHLGERLGAVAPRRDRPVWMHTASLGELPSALLAEEILTPGAGQVRALVTFAGNPVLSTPNSEQLERALVDLDFMVSIDIYLNETTRHADVILPAPSHLERSHFDLSFTMFSVRNMANYSEPVFERESGQPDEWEILAKLALIAQGLGAQAEPKLIDDLVIGQMVDSAIADPSSVVHGRNRDELLSELDGNVGVDRMLDLLLRTGPYGDGFGARPGGLSLQELRANPHGVDLGPLEPRMPEILRTPSGKIELAHEALIADLERLRASRDTKVDSMLLIGRRHLRSNNSWMHNVNVLVKGKPRCTLQINPSDAARLGIEDGASVRVESRVGSVVAPAEVTDDIRPSVVSLPHGWGHDKEGTRMRVASEHAGVNSNVLTDHDVLDPLSGNAALNAIPVTIHRL